MHRTSFCVSRCLHRIDGPQRPTIENLPAVGACTTRHPFYPYVRLFHLGSDTERDPSSEGEPPCGRLPSPVGTPAPVVALVVAVDAWLSNDSGDDGVCLSFNDRLDRNGPRIFGGSEFAASSADVVPCVVLVSAGLVGGLVDLVFSSVSGWLSVGGGLLVSLFSSLS